MISLQVKYSVQSFLTGDVIAVRSGDHVYCEGDCKKKWLEAGRSAKSWTSAFAIIYLSDCEDINDLLIQELLTPYSDDPDAPYKRKYFIQMPDNTEDAHRVLIRSTGETIATLAEINALTVERI
jgi:hypothetical protein